MCMMTLFLTIHGLVLNRLSNELSFYLCISRGFGNIPEYQKSTGTIHVLRNQDFEFSDPPLLCNYFQY